MAGEPWPDRRFAALLGSRHPVLLAPMAELLAAEALARIGASA